VPRVWRGLDKPIISEDALAIEIDILHRGSSFAWEARILVDEAYGEGRSVFILARPYHPRNLPDHA
jgi:hypothetical protein